LGLEQLSVARLPVERERQRERERKNDKTREREREHTATVIGFGAVKRERAVYLAVR